MKKIILIGAIGAAALIALYATRKKWLPEKTTEEDLPEDKLQKSELDELLKNGVKPTIPPTVSPGGRAGAAVSPGTGRGATVRPGEGRTGAVILATTERPVETASSRMDGQSADGWTA